MTKDEILFELHHRTYAMLQPSPLHGIGVFAIRDIPRGCRHIFSQGHGEWVKVPVADVEKLPPYARNLVETYCLYDKDHYFVHDYGFKVVDIVNYLNHSSEPNLVSVNNGDDFEAMVDIPAGTELVIDYHSIVDGLEKY